MKKAILFISILSPIIFLSLMTGANNPEKHYAEEHGWLFDNWDAFVHEQEYPEELQGLRWDIYNKTFFGIPSSQSSDLAGADSLFYDEVYKSVADDGHCFGMSLLSLIVLYEGGDLGMCGPLPVYSGKENNKGPSEHELARAIKILHGHQLNVEAVKYYLELFGSWETTFQGIKIKSKNGLVAFNTIKEYFDKKEGVLICITRSITPQDGGHTMVPYKLADEGGNKKIYLYDPSHPYYGSDKDFYADKDNFILVNSDGEWEYHKLGWSGTPWLSNLGEENDGHIIALPISLVNSTSQSPVGAVQDTLTDLLLFSGEGASLKQVTDGRGKRMYIPGTNIVDPDPSTGMRNITPLFFFEQVTSGKIPQAFLAFGTYGGKLHIEVENGTRGYRVIHMGERGYTMVRASGGKRTSEVFSLIHPGTHAPSVTLNNQSNVSQYQIEFRQISTRGESVRSFQLDNVKLKERESATMGVSRDRSVLWVNAPEKTLLQYDLVLKNITRKETLTLQKKSLVVPKDASVSIRPYDWRTLEKNRIEIKTEKKKKAIK